ncbi:5922_t:CDS:2 [Diversispora eburnea]|uniref:5922_t:CDS:1 n=1 Tax=Diversispora eburnea TaxID=1213867 RepID=A0A9N8VLH4_9GLOM|nr:5922_t:CDS:2 [Diversispora eburnea]
MPRSNANQPYQNNHNGTSNDSRLQLPLSVVEIATPSTLSSMPNQIERFSTSSSINDIFKSSRHLSNHLHNQNEYHRSQQNQESDNNTPISTTNVILDYLLYLSINARLEQAKNDLQDLTEQPSTIASHRKKGQGVDAIVEETSLSLPLPLKHRLCLCQLLHLVFDRSNLTSSSPLKSTRILQSSTNKRKLPSNLAKFEKHFKNPLLSRCRKHRLDICNECNQNPDQIFTFSPWSRKRTKPIPTRKTAPGLIDSIPVFINNNAITYRLTHKKSGFEQNEPSILVKPIWYDLLLSLLTQSAIECYLCDSYSSIDALLEIFSYGDIDPSDYHSDDSESEDENPHIAANRADDYLLWQRTKFLDEFREKKKERMEEFLNVKGKLEQHFENLAIKYPLRHLEEEMLGYCRNVANSQNIIMNLVQHENNGERVDDVNETKKRRVSESVDKSMLSKKIKN